jgi:hypothetical protein
LGRLRGGLAAGTAPKSAPGVTSRRLGFAMDLWAFLACLRPKWSHSAQIESHKNQNKSSCYRQIVLHTTNNI